MKREKTRTKLHNCIAESDYVVSFCMQTVAIMFYILVMHGKSMTRVVVFYRFLLHLKREKTRTKLEHFTTALLNQIML